MLTRNNINFLPSLPGDGTESTSGCCREAAVGMWRRGKYRLHFLKAEKNNRVHSIPNSC